MTGGKRLSGAERLGRAALVVLLSLMLLSSPFVLFAGCGEEGGGKLKVAATIFPLADFSKQVGGKLVQVETLVPPGASPHTYEPTPSQVEFIAQARVLVSNGLGLEEWLSKAIEKAARSDLVKVVVAEEIPKNELIRVEGAHGKEHEEHGHEIYDPHVWMDPLLAIQLVEAIAEGFASANAANAREYQENARKYIERLKELDGRIRARTSKFRERKFVAFHSSLTYFARRYELQQVASIEELPGKEPSAKTIGEILSLMRQEGVKVIFVEPQFDPKVAVAISKEAGSDISVAEIDPLGNPKVPEKSNYIQLSLSNLEVMAGFME